MISHAEYCQNICGAKCCKIPSEDFSCPKLTKDNLCSIYQERFAEGQPAEKLISIFRSKIRGANGQIVFKAMSCGRIAKLITDKKLPPEVEAQCCFAHPELLDIRGTYEGTD